MRIEISKRIYNGKYNIGSIMKEISIIEVTTGGVKNTKQIHIYNGNNENRIIEKKLCNTIFIRDREFFHEFINDIINDPDAIVLDEKPIVFNPDYYNYIDFKINDKKYKVHKSDNRLERFFKIILDKKVMVLIYDTYRLFYQKQFDREKVKLHYSTSCNEEERFESKHNEVEYLTTMKYIHEYLKPDDKILEVGAATGRYTLILADKGYEVKAVDLSDRNIETLKSNIKPGHKVTADVGDATDLSSIQDNTYDMTLLLGPMYHLFNDEDKRKALSEAVRVTKPNGYVFVAYCGNEATIYDFVFKKNNIKTALEEGIIDSNFHKQSYPGAVFVMHRKEDIDELIKDLKVKRLHFVGTDMMSRLLRETVDNMSEETFKLYLKYHYSICERADCVGISSHMLDILQKEGN